MAELKPCPFCGSNNVLPTRYEDDDSCVEYYAIWCDCCNGAIGPFDTQTDAEKAWNRRAGEVEKVGEWTEIADGVFECSACECCDYNASPYCPDCGAKMEG